MAKQFEKDIKTLTPRHFKILDLCYKGMNGSQIAEQIGMSSRQVRIVLGSPSFKHELAIRRASTQEREDDRAEREEDEVIKTLKDNTIKAVDKLVKHIDSDDDKISLKASMDILDRAGYTKKEDKQSQQNGMKIIIDKENAEIIVETMTMIQSTA